MTTRYDLTADECAFLTNALRAAAEVYKTQAGNCRIWGAVNHRLAEQFEHQELQALALAESFERGM